MQNFHFHGRKEKTAYTPFTAPYVAFVQLGRVFTRFSPCLAYGAFSAAVSAEGRVCRLISLFCCNIYSVGLVLWV